MDVAEEEKSTNEFIETNPETVSDVISDNHTFHLCLSGSKSVTFESRFSMEGTLGGHKVATTLISKISKRKSYISRK